MGRSAGRRHQAATKNQPRQTSQKPSRSTSSLLSTRLDKLDGPDIKEILKNSDQITDPEHQLWVIGPEGDLPNWERGGTESYIYKFNLITPEKTLRLIAKTCIKIAATQTMDEWLERRAVIASQGNYTPILLGRTGPTIIEERLPAHLNIAVKQASIAAEMLEQKAQDLEHTIKQLGFKAVGSLRRDMMTDMQKVVLVDFGSDLGSST